MTKYVGDIGENIACQFLKKRGYKLIARNYRKPWGELDIIARDQDKKLIFFEVKTLKYRDDDLKELKCGNFAGLKPEDNLTRAKLKKLIKISESFANSNPKLIDEKSGWQIDLITVALSENLTEAFPSSLTKIENNYIIKHYKNISDS